MSETSDISEKTETSGDSIPDRVYEQIREAIRRGKFIPGSRLRERDVASQFNVSRTPVREALRRLERDGILTSAPQKGLKIAELDHQMISELYYMRELLESTAAALAAKNASSAEKELMRLIVNEEAQFLESPADLSRLNYALHQTIQGAARNRYLVTSLNTLRDALMLIQTSNLQNTQRAEAAHQEHLRIVEAIEAGNADDAKEAAKAHISAAYAAKLVERTASRTR
ncbi:GntR family transcriptional regulator [Chelativorans xinjiangense]|uniref:GntR family transcriptional regulator n=1 Tax=Chelativorans xinjiangense TaxID=2681485 RepID=UPI001358F13E|nr:GntR family transcriptional regulator [Chelativorans xinjiangense]